MQNITKYQQRLIELLVQTQALKFGEFTTKSGRATPYFINMGNFDRGSSLQALGKIYAEHLIAYLERDFNVVFGPAYKAIPLAVATAQALCAEHNYDVGFAFNRKEAKQHGEGGNLVGCKLDADSKVAIVEDVITAGSTLREIVPLLRNQLKANVKAVVLAVDRCEKGSGDKSALFEIEQELQIRVLPIVSIHQIVRHLANANASGFQLDRQQLNDIAKYLEAYGA